VLEGGWNRRHGVDWTVEFDEINRTRFMRGGVDKPSELSAGQTNG